MFAKDYIEVHRKQATMFHVTSDSGSLSVSDIGKAPFEQEKLLRRWFYTVLNHFFSITYM